VLSYYSDAGLLRTVQAEGQPAEITARLEAALSQAAAEQPPAVADRPRKTRRVVKRRKAKAAPARARKTVRRKKTTKPPVARRATPAARKAKRRAPVRKAKKARKTRVSRARRAK
jgi:hypothetical protein